MNAYLNHAGTSWPKPEPVRVAVAEALCFPPADWPDQFRTSHGRVADALGVTDPTRLLLTPGCTTALSLAVTDLPWQPGDRIIVSSLEHHALYRPVTQLRERGVEVHAIPRAANGPLDLELLGRELRAKPVRLVAMTAACNVTGELLPVEEIVSLAHEHEALCLLDGAQVCGWIPVHVGTLGVDLFAFAGHKGLQGPGGIGGLYVASHVTMSSPAASCEIPAEGTAPACSNLPGYCDAGSVDRAALAGLTAALDWLAAPRQSDRLGHARRLVERLTGALEERPGVRLHGSRDPELRLPTVAFTVDRRPVGEIVAAFTRAGVTIGAGLQCAPLAHESLGTAPGGVIRLSAGPMTTKAVIEEALAVVTEL